MKKGLPVVILVLTVLAGWGAALGAEELVAAAHPNPGGISSSGVTATPGRASRSAPSWCATGTTWAPRWERPWAGRGPPASLSCPETSSP